MMTRIGDVARMKTVVLEGMRVRDEWIWATVCYVDRHKIGVTLRDGTRHMFPKGDKNLELYSLGKLGETTEKTGASSW